MVGGLTGHAAALEFVEAAGRETRQDVLGKEITVFQMRIAAEDEGSQFDVILRGFLCRGHGAMPIFSKSLSMAGKSQRCTAPSLLWMKR